MKIEGVRVDGYGALSGLEISKLSPNLTVVYGPNEAGKSTLLDFIRGVLFGFPDRRSRLPYRAPVNGGRHGGALFLESDDGRHLVLERYVDERRPRLSDDDGSVLDEAELTKLIGGADEALFRTVYAFGLTELSSLETLERDEVRDAVFSAGVLGAGRSATRAARSLEQRRATIVRQRQSEALANQLRRRLEELEGELRAARKRAQEYPSARSQLERLTAETRIVRKQGDELRRRANELDLLIRCWPAWRRRIEADTRLAALGDLPERQTLLLTFETTIERLLAERSGHDERKQKVLDLSSQLAGIDRRIATNEKVLEETPGLGTTRTIEASDEARAYELEHSADQIRAELSAASSELARARAELAAATTDRERAASGSAVAESAELDGRERNLVRLRRSIGELDAREAAFASSLREAALLAARQPSRSPYLILGALGAALGAVGAALSVSRHDSSIAISCAIAAALVVAACVLVGARRVESASSSTLSADEIERAELTRRGEEIAELASRVGLASRPHVGDVEDAIDATRTERAERERCDALTQRVLQCETRARDAGERARLTSDALDSAESAITQLLSDLGATCADLPPHLSPLVVAARSLQSDEAAKVRVVRDLAAQSSELRSFEAEVVRIAREVSISSTTNSDDASITTLYALSEALELGRSERELRLELAERIAGDDSVLAEQFGVGAQADRLFAELSTGELLAWETERVRLGETVTETDGHYEQLVRELAEQERVTDDLLASHDVADLELEHDAVALALTEALEQWITLGVAKTLLERTLARYERERQPAVIAQASELFASITARRYTKLVAREDPDGSRQHGLEAITASGVRVDSGDLSRGTAEQLYLCLRLAFAVTFAERSVSLPLILDDVLVNFDPGRARNVARVIAAAAAEHQVLAFTCQPHVVEYFQAASTDLTVVELEQTMAS